MSAQEFKDLGNKAFQAGQYTEAVEHYSNAIALEENHVFFSNRSGAYLAMGKNDEALEDADQCIEISPSFVKGYTRRAAALEAKKHWKDAAAAYEQALKMDPGNNQYRTSLAECLRLDRLANSPPPQQQQQQQMPPGMPGGPGGFSLVPPDFYQKLNSNPQTRAMVNNPQTKAALEEIAANPMSLSKHESTPGVIMCIQSLLGLTPEMQAQMAQAQHEDEQKKKKLEDAKFTRPYATPSMARDTTSVDSLNKDNTKEEEEVEEIDEELEKEKAERREKRANADKIKEEGADYYKKRDFDNALLKFREAAEIDDSNPVYFMNIAAVEFELQKYEESIQTCKDALTISGITPPQKGKCCARMANCYSKLKQFENSVQMFKKAILEDNAPTSRVGLRQAEQDLKKWKIESYYDDEKSEEAKVLGNKAYSDSKYAEAIDYYTDAIKRNPKNYKVYSNRALCYIKVAMWEKALEDCDTCLSFDPKFVKALVRKGKVHHFLKAYHKAMTCFEEALSVSPSDQEALDGMAATQRAIYSTHDSTPAGDEARLAAAMQDPEVAMGMQNPKIQQLLQDMQTNPDIAMKAFNDPQTGPLLQKLIAAGIIKLG